MIYQNPEKGVHTFQLVTQKPFAEFKDELNQAYDNSWLRSAIRITWQEKRVTFQAIGASGELTWESGRVSAQLRVTGPPSTWLEHKIVYETREVLRRACAYARTAEIEAENKESLRQSALQTYRDAYSNEVEAAILIGRWQKVDEVTKVLAALTSSSSAVAGWLVWKDDKAKNAWGILAGTASVLSIVHVALKVSDRVKDWSDTKGHFVRLRTELETFLYQMKVNPAFDLDEFMNRFAGLRTRFGEGVDRKKVDFLTFGARERAELEAAKNCDVLKQRTNPTLVGLPSDIVV